MTTFPHSRELPEKFAMVKSIRSIELRTKLVERIVIIQRLLKFFKTFEPAPQTVEKTDRFFSFLSTSCDSIETINIRAAWLTAYAKLIQRHLLEIQFGTTRDLIPSKLPSDHLLVQLVEQLGSTFTYYLAAAGYETAISIPELLIEITGLASLIKPDLDESNYIALHRLIEILIDDVVSVSNSKVIPTFTKRQDFLYRLMHIRYVLDNYISTKNYSSLNRY